MQTVSIVLNSGAKTAPNPSCCSNPDAMCGRCVNQAFRYQVDEDDVLVVPTINWAEEVAARRGEETLTTNVEQHYDEDLLIAPTIDWAKESLRQRGKC